MKRRFIVPIITFGLLLAGLGTFYFWYGRADVSSASTARDKAGPTFGPAALDWRLLAWRDENGEIPDGGLADALAERDGYLVANLDADGFGDRPISPLRPCLWP